MFLDVAKVEMEIGFPIRSDPNINVYGPLTRRLFAELSRLALLQYEQRLSTMGPDADTPPTTSRPSTQTADDQVNHGEADDMSPPVFLTKRLLFIVEDVRWNFQTALVHHWECRCHGMVC